MTSTVVGWKAIVLDKTWIGGGGILRQPTLLQEEFSNWVTISSLLQEEFSNWVTISSLLQEEFSNWVTISSLLQEEFSNWV
jgi:hypothetical protein